MIRIGALEECTTDAHIWMWIGKNALDDSPPPDDFKCRCGKVAWKDRSSKQDANPLLVSD